MHARLRGPRVPALSLSLSLSQAREPRFFALRDLRVEEIAGAVQRK